MGNVRIVTDSTADIPPEIVDELGIIVVPLQVTFGDESYRDGVDLPPDTFYRRLAKSAVLPTTSQPSVAAFEEAYDEACHDSDSILSIHLSSALSGTYNSALIARDSFRNRCSIEVLDSRLVSMALGFVAISCARMAQSGASLRDLTSHAKRMIPNVHILFLVDTLEYLQKGGRIGRAQAFLGTLLNVRPLLKIEDGEVRPAEKVRTRAKAIDRLVEFADLFSDITDISVVYSTTPDDAEFIVQRLGSRIPRDRAIISQLGAVIGTHTGPGTLGVVVSQGIAE
jgi:DegV family protein with EDD domain